MTTTIQPNSLITLHYRISLENGQPLISTFETTPATLQLGAGDLLPTLENLLFGLENGSQRAFTLTPELAFGPYRDDLVEQVKIEHLPDPDIEIPSIMEFTAPDGSRYPGLVREKNATTATVDFNHPLAGKTIRFEVHILGILDT